jgi:hypothetical protein
MEILATYQVLATGCDTVMVMQDLVAMSVLVPI